MDYFGLKQDHLGYDQKARPLLQIIFYCQSIADKQLDQF